MASQLEVDLIVKALSQGFDKLSKDLGDLGNNVEKKTKPPPDAPNKWTELSSAIGLARQGLGYVQQAAKFAYDSLEKGAALTQAQSQFENLAMSIGTTADSIDVKLKAATNGMMSQAERVAGASQIISLGLANNETDVVRLAKSVGTLGLDMQQVILTFANNSKARLDSLGLSVEDVTKKAAELEAQGFKGDAFDEAVLIGLEQKMRLLGDASETTAGKLKILNSAWEDTRNAFDVAFAENAAGALAGVADNADNVSVGAQKLSGIFGGALARSLIDLVDGFGTTRLLLTKMGQSELEAQQATEDLAKEAEAADAIFQNYAATVETVNILHKDEVQINEETGLAMRGLTDEYRAAMRVLGEHSPALEQDTRAMEDAAYASGELGNQQERLQEYLSATPQYAVEAANAIAGITAGATGATVGVGGLNSALDVAMGKSTELITPLQEIFGAMEQFQALETANQKIADMANNQQFAADEAVVLEEKLTGVYTGIEDTGSQAVSATGLVGDYIARLGEIPAEVTTTLIVNQEVRGGGAYGGGNQGYAPANQYAAGSTGNRGESQTYGGSYRSDYDPSQRGHGYASGTGGWQTVPGPIGAPFPATLHGGEMFNVVPAGQVASGVGGMQVGTVNIYAQPGQNGEQLYNEFMRKAAREARLKRT